MAREILGTRGASSFLPSLFDRQKNEMDFVILLHPHHPGLSRSITMP